MDIETAQAIQALTRMVDHVHSTHALNGLQFNITVALAASARRHNQLGELEIRMIETSFEEIGADIEQQPYEKSKELYRTARELWETAKPSTER